MSIFSPLGCARATSKGLNDIINLYRGVGRECFKPRLFSRDEINWYIRHYNRDNQNRKTNEEDYRDPKISELIANMIQLRSLVERHSSILSNVGF